MAVYRELFDFPGYRIGDDGSVWSRHKQGPNTGTWGDWKRSSVYVAKGGYLQVGLTRRDGKHVTRTVHSLVLEAFVGPRPDGMIARHFPDPDRTNNQATNLRWGTQQQNSEDRERDGNTARGERNANAKLTADDVRHIRANDVVGPTGRNESVSALARKYGVSRTIIWQIRRRKIWKHI